MRSYRDLPLILYHFQTKGRDEPRPRAGVLRTREFIMKDSYTFDRDAEGLAAGYDKHIGAYDRIFDRVGLEWYRVESDVGNMGGIGAHEYMAPCAAGENDVALAPGFAANVEVASADAQPVELLAAAGCARAGRDAGDDDGRAVAARLGVPPGALLKAYPGGRRGRRCGWWSSAAITASTRSSSRNALGADFRPAHPDEVAERIGPARLHRPGGRPGAGAARRGGGGRGGYVAGANEPDAHLRGVEPGRDFPFERVDVRRVEEGDTVDGQPIRIEPAIEIGNIFKLGTRYSEPLGATYLDESGSEQLIWMGSYGIGPARMAAAAVEQFADERGHLLAALDRAVGRRARRCWAARAPASASWPSGSTTSWARAAWTSSTTTATRAPGRSSPTPSCSACRCGWWSGRRTVEAGDVEAQVRRGREDRDAAARGRRPGRAAACGRRCRRRSPRPPAPDGQAAGRPGPLRASAARDAARALRCARGRSPTRSASCAWR